MGVALARLCEWLAATPLSHAIQAIAWIIPTLQTVHILCVAVLFSSAVLVDLRLLQVLGRDLSLPGAARRYLPTIWPVLAILMVTGSLLIIAEPRRSLLNSAFLLKMALLVIAVILTGGLQWSLSSPARYWELNRARRVAGGFLAMASMLVWAGILFAGRWIAYTQAG